MFGTSSAARKQGISGFPGSGTAFPFSQQHWYQCPWPPRFPRYTKRSRARPFRPPEAVSGRHFVHARGYIVLRRRKVLLYSGKRNCFPSFTIASLPMSLAAALPKVHKVFTCAAIRSSGSGMGNKYRPRSGAFRPAKEEGSFIFRGVKLLFLFRNSLGTNALGRPAFQCTQSRVWSGTPNIWEPIRLYRG